MTNQNSSFGTNTKPGNTNPEAVFGYFPYPANYLRPSQPAQQAMYQQQYYYPNPGYPSPTEGNFTNNPVHPAFQQIEPQTSESFQNSQIPLQQTNTKPTSLQENYNQQTQHPTQFRVTPSGRSKIVTQQELLKNQAPKSIHRQIPVNTGQANNYMVAFKNKLAGTNIETKAPTSGIIPVRIFSKKMVTPAPEFTEKKKVQSFKQVEPKVQELEINQNSFGKNLKATKPILGNSNIYTKDFAQNLDKKVTDKKKSLKSERDLKKPRKRNKLGRFVAAAAILLTLLGGFGVYAMQKNTFLSGLINPAVAGEVNYKGSDVENFTQYKKWVLDENKNQYSAPNDDLDNDQLTNYEEFILQTNPNSANTCSKDSTDIENLLKLIDPVSCLQIDLNNKDLAEKYGQVINLPNIQAKLVESLNNESNPEKPSNLLELFAVDNYNKINSINELDLSKEILQKNTKIEYLRTIKKIDIYIEKYRSYKSGDRDYPTPVNGAVYLDVSLRYNTPLKYSLAIARLESRFGTDRFLPSGNLTRPAEYKNIYSMGLTDSSSSGFNTWEQGVESFGKWYKRFEDRKVSNCSKWKIYNPNGDYCSKVETLAAEIEAYLKS